MLPRNRRKRAILRERFRDRHRSDDRTPLFGPLTGYDLFLIHRYYPRKAS